MIRKQITFQVSLVVPLIALLLTNIAGATTPTLVGTFDDLPYKPGYGIPGTVPNGYLGLNWDQLIYFEAATRSPTAGYLPATISSPHVTANSFENPVTITTPASGQRFTFVGAYFGAGWNSGLQIKVDGFVNSTLKNSQTITGSPTGAQWFEFNYDNINKLVISSFGGTPFHAPTSFTHFGMDNFTITAVVPEPCGALIMVWAGMAIVSHRRPRSRR